MKKYLAAAILAVLPFTVSAHSVGVLDDSKEHFAYWQTTDGELLRTDYGECVVTITDDSYHHTVEEALACGDATKVTASVMRFVAVPSAFHFEFDSAVIDEEAQKVLQEVALAISNLDDVRVLIVGHTDAVGTIEYNLDLGWRRAENAVGVLNAWLHQYAKDVGGIRIRTTSAGESELVVDTPNRERQNRRVSIFIEWFGTEEVIVQ